MLILPLRFEDFMLAFPPVSEDIVFALLPEFEDRV